MKKVILAGLMSVATMGANAAQVECSDATLMSMADDFTVVHNEVQDAGAYTIALINYLNANGASMTQVDRDLLQIQINGSFDRGFKAQADLNELQESIAAMCGPDAVAKVIMAAGL